jgi:hypothetical protein
MRVLLCILMTALTVAAADDQPVLEVFMPSVLDLQMYHALVRAEDTVNKIYDRIGIRVLWRTSNTMPTGCLKRAQYSRIVVDLQTNIPPNVSANALAFTTLGSTEGACITLLLDRLETALQINPFGTTSLISNVLVHEIGHVLQGTARHSDMGVMKATWSGTDIMTMSTRQLQFTPFDTELIREGLESRKARETLDEHSKTGHR